MQQQQKQYNWHSTIVRFATKLTSGALCIHTLSILYSYNQDSMELPSSTVAHYTPRQQRPAISVAGRPGTTNLVSNVLQHRCNLVAIGLVGSGSAMGIHALPCPHWVVPWEPPGLPWVPPGLPPGEYRCLYHWNYRIGSYRASADACRRRS